MFANLKKQPFIKMAQLSTPDRRGRRDHRQPAVHDGMRIDGRVKGDVTGRQRPTARARRCSSSRPTARIEGSVRCGDAVINGTVSATSRSSTASSCSRSARHRHDPLPPAADGCRRDRAGPPAPRRRPASRATSSSWAPTRSPPPSGAEASRHEPGAIRACPGRFCLTSRHSCPRRLRLHALAHRVLRPGRARAHAAGAGRAQSPPAMAPSRASRASTASSTSGSATGSVSTRPARKSARTASGHRRRLRAPRAVVGQRRRHRQEPEHLRHDRPPVAPDLGRQQRHPADARRQAGRAQHGDVDVGAEPDRPEDDGAATHHLDAGQRRLGAPALGALERRRQGLDRPFRRPLRARRQVRSFAPSFALGARQSARFAGAPERRTLSATGHVEVNHVEKPHPRRRARAARDPGARRLTALRRAPPSRRWSSASSTSARSARPAGPTSTSSAGARWSARSAPRVKTVVVESVAEGADAERVMRDLVARAGREAGLRDQLRLPRAGAARRRRVSGRASSSMPAATRARPTSPPTTPATTRRAGSPAGWPGGRARAASPATSPAFRCPRSCRASTPSRSACAPPTRTRRCACSG